MKLKSLLCLFLYSALSHTTHGSQVTLLAGMTGIKLLSTHLEHKYTHALNTLQPRIPEYLKENSIKTAEIAFYIEIASLAPVLHNVFTTDELTDPITLAGLTFCFSSLLEALSIPLAEYATKFSYELTQQSHSKESINKNNKDKKRA